MSCLTEAVFVSDMVWRGELSGYGRSSEDSEGVRVIGLGGAESCSELLGWSRGGLLPDDVVSERKGLEWGGVV